MDFSRCLYCSQVTGFGIIGAPTVCESCAQRPQRYERREVQAGLPPWPRPLRFSAYVFGYWRNALPDKEAAIYREKIERERSSLERSLFRLPLQRPKRTLRPINHPGSPGRPRKHGHDPDSPLCLCVECRKQRLAYPERYLRPAPAKEVV